MEVDGNRADVEKSSAGEIPTTESVKQQQQQQQPIPLVNLNKVMAEYFELTEVGELSRLIDDLSEASVADVVQREVAYEKFLKIVDHHQEQPQVVDPHLERLIGALLTKGRKSGNSFLLTNQAFTYIYLIVKMRGYKVVIRYFPHEVQDLAPILTMLEVSKRLRKEGCIERSLRIQGRIRG